MAENFLEEQLRRIREMTKQMSSVRDRAAELSREFERERAMMRHSPLQDVRDLRSYFSPQPARDHADERVGRHGRYHSRRRRK